jgi:mRNA interferase RelE/StbE
MYQVVIEKQAEKQLSKIPNSDYIKIVSVLRDLANNPRPAGYKKLKGRPGYRVRIGNYRVIYSIQDNILVVYVLAVGHRKDIYE